MLHVRLIDAPPSAKSAVPVVKLEHPDAVLRRFAAAVAIRPREFTIERFVAMAEQAEDAEVRKIAADCRQGYLRPTYAIGPSALLREGKPSA